MAGPEGVTLDPMSGGNVVATDLIGGFDYQIVKLAFGADGVATQIDSTNPLPVTINADAVINLTQLAGTAVAVNSGNKSNGTLRVVIATDQPNFTTPWNINTAQMNGVTVLMGNGSSGTGAQRVTIADDSTGQIIVRGTVAQDAPVSGNPVLIGARASAAEPTSMSADGDSVFVWTDRKGRQVVKQQAGTGTGSSVAASASNVTLLAANTARLGGTIYNDSTAVLYIRLQATASTSNFAVKMQPDDYFEVPSGYVGIIDGIWALATGNARISEIT